MWLEPSEREMRGESEEVKDSEVIDFEVRGEEWLWRGEIDSLRRMQMGEGETRQTNSLAVVVTQARRWLWVERRVAGEGRTSGGRRRAPAGERGWSSVAGRESEKGKAA